MTIKMCGLDGAALALATAAHTATKFNVDIILTFE